MANEQGRTIQTIGELKQQLNQFPDDAKIAWGDSAMSAPVSGNEGVQFLHTGGRVLFGQPSTGQQRA
jgi:hypothetical protein